MESTAIQEIPMKTNDIRNKVNATASDEAWGEVNARLDDHSATYEFVVEVWRRRAVSDAEVIIQNRLQGTDNSTYSEVFGIALRSLEGANAIKGGPLENCGETVFYDVYLATLDSILEERNVRIIAPRNLRFFGEPEERPHKF